MNHMALCIMAIMAFNNAKNSSKCLINNDIMITLASSISHIEDPLYVSLKGLRLKNPKAL